MLPKPAHTLLRQVQSLKLTTQLNACDAFLHRGYPGRTALLQGAKGFFLSPCWDPDGVAQSQKVTLLGETQAVCQWWGYRKR